MARMKIEVQAARVRARGLPFAERLVATLPRWAGLASRVAVLPNARARLPPLARLAERWLGLAADRPLPRFRRDAFHDGELPAPTGAAGEVILLPDAFNRYFEPENLRAAIRVLRAAGYRPTVARAGRRPLEDGRTLLAAGLVDDARAEARRLIAALAPFPALPVLGLEPSCLLTLRDEYPALLPGAETMALAARAQLVTEFLAAAKPTLALRPIGAEVHVHGHCHQKAFGAFAPTIALLSMIPDLKVVPITASCCGMAGAFGYQARHQAASRAMAELALLPALRKAPVDALVAADGTSCRHQIGDLAGREAMHTLRLLDRALAS